MIINLKDTVSMPVILQKNGKKLGVSLDFTLHDDSFELSNMIFRKNSFTRINVQIPISLIENCTGDTMIVSTDAHEFIRPIDDSYTATQLLNKRVFSPEGKELGMVSDLILDLKKQEVIYMEISDGLINDLKNGRRLLPLIGKTEYKNDYIIVNKEAFDEMGIN